ncbi:MAG: oligosaccharide flippase family protein [Bacteroidales bacterium]|nr:oligosaccharide flippase family protein [Bacteroidales bacterium]
MGVVVRQTIKGTIMNYIGVLVGFITTFFIVTKYLTPEEVGLTRVLVDASILLSSLAQLGTSTSAMRYYPYFKDEKEKDHGFFGWSVIIPFVGFIVFTALFFVFKTPIENYFSQNSELFVDYIYFVIPMAFFMMYLLVFETNSNLLMRIVVPKFIREVGIRLMTLIAYLLYAFDVINLDGMVVSLCLTYGIATLLNVIYLFTLKKISFKIQPSYISKWLRKDFIFYTLFLIISSLASNLVPVLNTFFVSGKLGLAIAGINTIAVYIANMVEIPYRSLAAISRPQISQSMKDNNVMEVNALTKNVSLHQFMASSFIFFLIWINIDLLYTLIPNGNVYDEAKFVVFILAVVKIINTSLNVGATVLSYSKYYYYSLLFTIILTVSTIIMNIKLIPIWGIEGAAIASLISYLIYYTFLLTFVNWRVKVTPFSLKEFYTLLIIVSLFVIDWLLQTYISRYITSLFRTLIIGQILDSVLRTSLLAILGIVTIYKLRISKQVNDIIDKFLSLLKLTKN